MPWIAKGHLHIFVGPRNRKAHYYLDTEKGVTRWDEKDLLPADEGHKSFLAQKDYSFRWWHIAPAVIETSTSGKSNVVFHTSILLWPFTAPLTAFLFVLIGIIAANRIAPRSKKRQA